MDDMFVMALNERDESENQDEEQDSKHQESENREDENDQQKMVPWKMWFIA